MTGRSASFRLRFRFVPCVPCERARRSCAGACGTLSLSLGLPGARIVVLSVCARFGVNILCTGMWVLRAFDRYCGARAPFVDVFSMGFKDLFGRPACICMGFEGYHHKTHANSMQVMLPMLKTRVNIRNCWLSS